MARDNNQLIAEKIYEIENAHWKQKKEWAIQKVSRWRLTDDITMERSDDCIMWYLWKYNPDKCENSWLKCIPRLGYDKAAIETMLDAQHWVWI